MVSSRHVGPTREYRDAQTHVNRAAPQKEIKQTPTLCRKRPPPCCVFTGPGPLPGGSSCRTTPRATPVPKRNEGDEAIRWSAEISRPPKNILAWLKVARPPEQN